MKLDDLFPLIMVLLVIIVTVIRAIARALSASQKTPPAGRPPSAWEEFKKAFQSLAQEERERGRAEQEPTVEEPPQVLIEEEHPEGEREVIVVAPVRRPRVRIRRAIIAPAPQTVPQAPSAPAARHRPEELGTRIAEEVKDIVHPAIEAHLQQRGLLAQQPGQVAVGRPPAAEMLHLIGASKTDLQRAILLQEILSSPLADRPPGPLWIR